MCERGVVHHHRLASQAAEMGGAHTDFFNRGECGTNIDELANRERLVQQNHQIGKQLLGGLFERKAYADAASAQESPDRCQLHTEALEQHQSTHNPDDCPYEGLDVFEQLFEVAVASPGNTLKEADADAVDEADEDNRSHDSQDDVVSPRHIVG